MADLQRKEELEIKIRSALEGPDKDLGRLCKSLGEAFCLEPARNASGGADGDDASHDDREHHEDVLHAVSKAVRMPPELLARAWRALSKWRKAISEGDLLDVFNSTEGEWYLGKVLHVVPREEVEAGSESQPMEVDDDDAGGSAGEGGAAAGGGGAGAGDGGKEDGSTYFRIHYQGWPSKYDETLARHSPSLQPVHTHSRRPKKKSDRKKRRAKEVKEWIREDEFGNIVARGIVGEDDPYEDRAATAVVKEEEGAKPPEVEGATTNRYGRVVVPRVKLPTPKGKGKADDLSNGDGGEAAGGDAAEGEGDAEVGGSGGGGDCGGGSKGKKRTNRKALAADGGGAANSPDDWICATCSQLDTPCMSDMVTCDGPCLRSFHVVCLELGEDALSEERWLCEDCERGEHACWQCGDSGQDNVTGGVFRCGVPTCGRFYHRHCVELNTNSTAIRAGVDNEGEDGQPVFKFRCGYHTCDTCSSGRGGSKNHLYRCSKCPTAYHLNCIPPDARYHELALLCEAHPEDELPALKQEDSVLGGSGEGDEPAPAAFSLPPLKLPKFPPKAEHRSDLRHFRLPMSILTSYHSKPPPFQHICAMQFVAPRPPRMDPTPVCNCTGSVCGDSCLNSMLRTECVCGNGIRARYQNCKQGAKCGNRRLQNRVVAKVAPFREHGMGWGLKVAEDVSKGSLVGEYVGEVIDEAMVEHRMAEQRRLRPKDGEFYIMELGQSLFVDAKEKGNLMRLINHSCNPNCDVQAWNIAGYTRLGIYAKKDLAKGESLSYDYKFSTNETARFKCMCGAANCRGTLAPKKQEEEITEDGSKLKGKARKEMLQKRERMAKNRQARSQVGQMVTCKRLSLTGRLLPGDRTAEVKAGPPVKYFGFARDQSIFLVRNARAGADLLTRKRLLVTKAEEYAKKAALLAPPPPPPPPPATPVPPRASPDAAAAAAAVVAAGAGPATSGRRGRTSTARVENGRSTGSSTATAATDGRVESTAASRAPAGAAGAAAVAAAVAAAAAPTEGSAENPPPPSSPAKKRAGAHATTKLTPTARRATAGRSPGRAAATGADSAGTAIAKALPPSSPSATSAAAAAAAAAGAGRGAQKSRSSPRQSGAAKASGAGEGAGVASGAAVSGSSPGASTRQRGASRVGLSPESASKKARTSK